MSDMFVLFFIKKLILHLLCLPSKAAFEDQKWSDLAVPFQDFFKCSREIQSFPGLRRNHPLILHSPPYSRIHYAHCTLFPKTPQERSCHLNVDIGLQVTQIAMIQMLKTKIKTTTTIVNCICRGC